jgi:hypothetical protein
MMSEANFAISTGTIIHWRRGGDAAKAGVIVATIPKGASPVDAYPNLKKVSDSACKLGYGKTGESVHDRYLVKVERFHKRTGERIDDWFYAPSRATIESQN